MKIVITGAAGLVGQNLIARMAGAGQHQLVAIDKHAANLRILRQLHPDVQAIEADLSRPGDWISAFIGADAVVHAHAQIGGLHHEDFVRNNIDATKRVIEAIAQAGSPYVVNISSSVVNSAAVDWYTETKKGQEKLVLEAGFEQVVLRPTLMFGWFDRKHLGWLARFMRRVPVFPIPGDGKYLRQPLYVGDFCHIIEQSIARRQTGVFSIAGLERIDYIDLMRAVKVATGAKAAIVTVPPGLFSLMLRTYALFDRNPPFTVAQLNALMTPDVFEVIDWPGLFEVTPTPLNAALRETFQDPSYAEVSLEF
jgi:nucleoside-diphosphate-sugar epimerase